MPIPTGRTFFKVPNTTIDVSNVTSQTTSIPSPSDPAIRIPITQYRLNDKTVDVIHTDEKSVSIHVDSKLSNKELSVLFEAIRVELEQGVIIECEKPSHAEIFAKICIFVEPT